MLAHDRLDGFRRLVRVIERNRGDVVMKHVRFDDAVEEGSTNEAEFAVDGSRSATREVPGVALVMRKGGVCMLEEGDADCA